MSNRLINEKSPYLLSHATNPVDWYPWGDEAFEAAKSRNVPIFISIGYSSCHWCHVMEKQCFIDNDVAMLLNESFVSIKVDREERPDVDHIYMEACTAFSGSGGWPLSAFLNHNKTPFFAGTYFPKESFINLLQRIVDVWKNNRQELTNSGDKIMEYLAKDRAVTNEIDTINYERLYQKIARDFDPIYGGFHSAPKFPTPQLLLFLLRYATINPTSYADSILKKTLSSMADGGIFDHIGGGFFRYSTDRKWLAPHFEKMLYDNAMLTMVYAEASLAVDSSYKDIVERINNYLSREMMNEQGAFYTAEDADSEGVEGKYYLFTPSEIIEILGEEEGNKFNNDYDITANGNFEGKNIINRIGKGFVIDDPRIRRIFEYRDKRIKPFKDDKITTSSNGLMIASLSVAGRLLERESYIDQAIRCAEFIDNNLFVNNRLMARWRQGEAKHLSTLDDYAYLLWGYVELYYATNKSKWLMKAIALSDDIINLFSDSEGGMFMSGNDVEDLPIRQKVYYDGALPSGNAIIAYNFLRLYELTSDMQLSHIANGIMNDVYSDMLATPYGFSGHLCAFMQRDYGKNLVITDGDGLNKMINTVNGYNPFLNVSLVNDHYEELAELLSDYKDKISLDGKATAYFCDKYGCRPPVTDINKLSDYLSK